jgi:hypothetical protein
MRLLLLYEREGLSPRLERFMRELVTDSEPDTQGHPTKAFSRKQVRLSDKEFAELLSRGFIKTYKREWHSVLYPTPIAVKRYRENVQN